MEFLFLVLKKIPVDLIKDSFKFFVLFSVCISCSKYDTRSVIDNNDSVPPDPSLWSYFTVEGMDEDLDGVRDDIEIWINENFDDPNIRMALKQESRWDYKYMFATSAKEVLIIIENSRKASSCRSAVSFYKHLKLSQTEYHRFLRYQMMVNEKIKNNWWRRKKIKEVGKYVPSGSYKGAERNVLKSLSYCQFEVVNLKELLQIYYDSGEYKINASEEEREKYIQLLKELK